MVSNVAVEPARASVSRSRIEQADGLRALACMLVIWQHVSEVYKSISSGGLWLSDVADTVDFGRIGVSAFFAISGFVVPHSIRGPRLQGVVDFAERRFWRLYPPYWFSIPLGTLSVWIIWGKDASVATLIGNSTMVPSLWGEPFVMGHYWTLEVELAFYFACGLLYLIFGRINLVVALASLALAFVAKRHGWLSGTPDHWPFATLDLAIMFWGCCCRLAYDGAFPGWLGKNRQLVGVLLVAATSVIVLWEPLRLLWSGYARNLAGHRRLGWGYSLGIVSFLVWVLVARVRVRLLERLGKGTYSIYLLHPVVFYVAFKLVRGKELAAFEGMHLGVYLAVLVPLCVAVGMLGYYLIERPSDIFRRMLSQPPQAEVPHPASAPPAQAAQPKRFSSTPRTSRRSLHPQSVGTLGPPRKRRSPPPE